MVGGICTGFSLLLDRPWNAALGGAVRGLGAGGSADGDGTDIHTGAGLDDGPTEDQRAERAGLGFGRVGRGDADGSGAHCERFEPVGIVSRPAWFFGVVVGRSNFAAAQAALGRAGSNSATYSLRRGDATGRGGTYRRVPADALVQHHFAFDLWARISDHVWVGSGVHFLHLAAAARFADAGRNTYVCQSRSGGYFGMAAGPRTFDHARRPRVGGDSGSDCADPARRASGHQTAGSSFAACRNSKVRGMRLSFVYAGGHSTKFCLRRAGTPAR